MAIKKDNNKYAKEFYSQMFRASNLKDAYLKACKWYAQVVLSKDLNNVMVEYIKDSTTNTVTAKLYGTMEELATKEQHCIICKESHKSFYMSEETNCSWCKIRAYQNRIETNINSRCSYLKGEIAK